MRNRSSLTGGLILIFFGIIFLLNQVIDNAWPFLIIGLGAAFLVSGFVYRNGGIWRLSALLAVGADTGWVDDPGTVIQKETANRA